MKTFLFGLSVAAIVVWIYVDYRERQPISTSEWVRRMKKLTETR
jgi:hypothetical protein